MPECATESQLKEFFETFWLVGVTGSSYIDFDDYSKSPIHTNLDYTFTEQMSPNNQIYKIVKLNINEASLTSEQYTIFETKEKFETFLSTESVEVSTIKVNKDAYFMARF